MTKHFVDYSETQQRSLVAADSDDVIAMTTTTTEVIAINSLEIQVTNNNNTITTTASIAHKSLAMRAQRRDLYLTNIETQDANLSRKLSPKKAAP